MLVIRHRYDRALCSFCSIDINHHQLFVLLFRRFDQTKICLFVGQKVEPESPSRSALEFKGGGRFSPPPFTLQCYGYEGLSPRSRDGFMEREETLPCNNYAFM